MAVDFWIIFGIVCAFLTGDTSGKVYNISSHETYANTMWESNHPAYVTTDDVTRCYVSGREERSYWKIVLPETLVVASLSLTGEYFGNLLTRVGSGHDTVGAMAGHDANSICMEVETNGLFHRLDFPCYEPRVGNVISVTAESEDPENLKLCAMSITVI